MPFQIGSYLLLANLFLLYAFDMWMVREFPHIPFERYADDAICHCRTEAEARALWQALEAQMADCKLMLHPEKTKTVYCKDANRRGDFPDICFDFLGFQFRARKTMWTAKGKRIFTHGFLPAASPKALVRIGREIRGWALHQRSDKSLNELAAIYNPTIRGWIAYYSHFYRTQLRPTLRRIDAYVIRWARRKYRRMVHQTRGARDWFDRLRRAKPRLFLEGEKPADLMIAIKMSFPVLADDQPSGKAQPSYLLRLSDIMVATQLRHFKLWYAGQVKNWQLAN